VGYQSPLDKENPGGVNQIDDVSRGITLYWL
jgi:hypothetical protein